MAHAYQYLESLEEFYQIQTTSSQAVIIYSAAWCGPCKLLKEWLDTKYKGFPHPIVVVDVENTDLAVLYEHVSGLPTIEFLKDGQKVDEMVGYKKADLEPILEEMRKEVTPSPVEAPKQDSPKGVTKISMEDMF